MSPEQQDLFSAQPSHSGPVYVPFVRSSETSRAAAERIRRKLSVRRRMVLEVYIAAYPGDLTDNEGIQKNAVHPNTFRPRRIELVEDGYLRPNGERSDCVTHIWTGKKESDL